MKRYLFLASFLMILATPWLRAQESPTAIAERQEAEERHKRLNARVEDIEQAQQSIRDSLTRLNEEFGKLREEIARANNSSKDTATQESIKRLADAIQEVDKKRMADNERVLATLSDLKRGFSERPSPPVKPILANPPPPRTGTEKGYDYAIRQGDTLSGIVTALVKQGIKVSQKQVSEANPSVNWNKLKVGQKIFIPAPGQ